MAKGLPDIKKEIDLNAKFSGKGFERKDISVIAEISGRFKSSDSEQKGFNKAAAIIKELNSSLELKNSILTVNKFKMTSEKASLNLSGVINEDKTLRLSAVLLSAHLTGLIVLLVWLFLFELANRVFVLIYRPSTFACFLEQTAIECAPKHWPVVVFVNVLVHCSLKNDFE